MSKILNLQELRSFGLNPADWLVAKLRSAKHMVLLHRREADLRLLVEMKGRTIAAVKVPLRLSALSSRQG
jgi:hypothetical protein